MSAGETELDRIEEELLLLAAFLLSSGRGLLDEPPGYGPLRCLDAARRVLTLRATVGAADHPDLAALRSRLDDVMCGAMRDHELDSLLDDLCERLAAVLEETDAVSARTGTSS